MEELYGMLVCELYLNNAIFKKTEKNLSKNQMSLFSPVC